LFVEGGGRPFIGRRPLVKRGRSSREAVRRERLFVERGHSLRQGRWFVGRKPFIKRGRSLREGETVHQEEAIH